MTRSTFSPRPEVVPDPVAHARRRRARAATWIGFGAFSVIALLITSMRDLPAPGSPRFTLDPQLRVPVPPLTVATYHGNRHAIVIAVMLVIGLTGLAFASRVTVKTRSWLPVTCTLSGVAIVVPEVFFDVIGLVYYPTSPHDHAYDLFGRRMGWFIVAGWFGYAILTYLMVRVLESNPRTRTVWVLLGVACLGDVVLEEIFLKLEMYAYYGRQPLILLDRLPWWWIPCNSLGVLLAAVVMFRIRAHMRGWWSLGAFLITPLSLSATYGAIALPSWIVVNGKYPWLTTQLAGLMTVALGLALFLGIVRFLLDRDPFDLDSRDPRS